jgi:hypothetical protein
MKEERIQTLNDIGFEWSVAEKVDWDERFDQLKAFKKSMVTAVSPDLI